MAVLGKIRHRGKILVSVIGIALFAFIAEEAFRSCEASKNNARQQIGEVLGEKISYEDISFLAELRLLDSSSFVVKQYKFSNGKGQVFLYKRNLGYLLKIERGEYALPIYAVTQLGKEVLSIVDDAEADIDYLKDFSMSITKGKSDLVANCGYFITIDDGALLLKDGLKFEIPKQETKEAEINNDLENK